MILKMILVTLLPLALGVVIYKYGGEDKVFYETLLFFPSSIVFWIFPPVGYFLCVAQWPIIFWILLRWSNKKEKDNGPIDELGRG